jgi:3-hydroxyisobutyrate dehydrogenase-like beta-hydroxyacid dehydrogenase
MLICVRQYMSYQQSTSLEVSVIGLGAMGSGIARTLIEGGCKVSVWNRSRAKVDDLVAVGAIGCNEPREALDANTIVIVCVSDYAVWRHIIQEHSLASHFEDTCIIQLTTGTIDDVQTHASLIQDNGGRLVEGAVMCYPRNLGTDEAALLLSGAPNVVEECTPILSILDENWKSLGEDINQPSVLSRSLMSGLTGALMGLVNGAAICRAGGVSLDVFMKFNEGTNSILLAEQKRLIEAIRDGRTEENEASIKAWREGNQALNSVAASLGTNLTLQNSIQAVFQEGKRRGLDEHDLSALVDVFDPGQ